MSEEPIRSSYLFLPTYAPTVMYAAFFVAGVIMLYGLHRHLRRYGVGLPQTVRLLTSDFGTKLERFSEYALGEKKILRRTSGGVMHAAIFYGFLVLLVYTTLVFIQSDILPLFGVNVLIDGSFYLTLEFLGDALGLAFVLGLGIALYRRLARKLPQRTSVLDDYVVLGALLWIGASGFVLEALRFVAIPAFDPWAIYSPVGDVIAKALAVSLSVSLASTLYADLWWVHMFSVMALIAAVPYTKLVHVFTSGTNVAVAPEKPMGRLDTPFSLAAMMQDPDAQSPPNVTAVGGLAPLQLLALDACTNCGRCQEVCPAYAAGRDLSPRIVVQDLGAGMKRDRAGDVFADGTIREQELWSCTTCNACVNACPVLINQVDYIVEFRRTLVAQNRLDPLKKTFLENIGRTNNPFGLPQSERQTWLTDRHVPTVRENPGAEYLYWVGCQGSYDPRARRITEAVIKVLTEAKVSFAVLGNEEVCTGEPVRRMGEEARFQELAMRNIETIRASGAKKVVVHCAHCFNTFLNEYPELGGDFQVIHHSQLISQLVIEGRLRQAVEGGRPTGHRKVTFHDPCNLGRINHVFEPPREVLRAEGLDVVEMRRNKANGFCCGGGGANVWYEVPGKKKIGVIRVEEALETGAQTLAVGCPFCVAMFEDAAKTIGDESLSVKDIAEIVAENIPESGSDKPSA
jgi:Fe-S oxidoreductase/nitrate reductase gamma subunit